MEINAFRSFKMALGMGGGDSSTMVSEEPPVPKTPANDDNKPRADSSSSNSSSTSSRDHSSSDHSRSGHSERSRRSHSHSRSHRRRHRPSSAEEELNLPLDQDFVALHDDGDHGDHGDSREAQEDTNPDHVRDEVICTIFDLPRSTTFYQDFSCAIAAAFPMHGRMYPTNEHVCFYSNVFGRERKIVIPYETVTEMTRTSTLMFQRAIRITTSSKEEFTFTSFWGTNRESCFELLASMLPPPPTAEQAQGEQQGEGEEQRPASPSSSPRPQRLLPRTVSDGGIVVAAAAATRDSSMTPIVVDEIFDISVETFLTQFILDDAPFGFAQYNAQIGTTEMQCNPWSAASSSSGTADTEGSGSASLGRTRAVQFRVPIDAPIGPKSSMVDMLQCYKTDEQSASVVIETSTRLVDIPYGDSFSVEDRWTLVPTRGRRANSCSLTIELKVVFSKSTFWKGPIESRALSDNTSKWAAWVQMAKAHLAGSSQGSTTTDGSSNTTAAATSSVPRPLAQMKEGAAEVAAGTGTQKPTLLPLRQRRRATGVVLDVESTPRDAAVSLLRGADADADDRSKTGRADRERGSRRHRRHRPLAAKAVLPWLVIVVLVAVQLRLMGTLHAMEKTIQATDRRVLEIHREISQLRQLLAAAAARWPTGGVCSEQDSHS